MTADTTTSSLPEKKLQKNEWVEAPSGIEVVSDFIQLLDTSPGGDIGRAYFDRSNRFKSPTIVGNQKVSKIDPGSDATYFFGSHYMVEISLSNSEGDYYVDWIEIRTRDETARIKVYEREEFTAVNGEYKTEGKEMCWEIAPGDDDGLKKLAKLVVDKFGVN